MICQHHNLRRRCPDCAAFTVGPKDSVLVKGRYCKIGLHGLVYVWIDDEWINDNRVTAAEVRSAMSLSR